MLRTSACSDMQTGEHLHGRWGHDNGSYLGANDAVVHVVDDGNLLKHLPSVRSPEITIWQPRPGGVQASLVRIRILAQSLVKASWTRTTPAARRGTSPCRPRSAAQ
jgi:hypothetical protein